MASNYRLLITKVLVFFALIVKGQSSVPFVCDSIIGCKDFDIFNNKPIFKKNKKKDISLCLIPSKALIFLQVKKISKAYCIEKKGEISIISSADSTYGAHKYKNLYDSIVVTDTMILFQRKYFTLDKRLISAQLKIIYLNLANLTGEYFEFYPPDNFNISEYVDNIEKKTYNLNLKFANIAGKKFRFEKKDSVLYFNNKSFFMHFVDYCLDFFFLPS